MMLAEIKRMVQENISPAGSRMIGRVRWMDRGWSMMVHSISVVFSRVREIIIVGIVKARRMSQIMAEVRRGGLERSMGWAC